MTDAITIVIADDHPLFRKGVADMIRGDAAMRVVGEASNGEQALQLIRSLRPRIAVLDFEMPKLTGLDVVRTLAAESSATAAVLLTMHEGTDMLQMALGGGVRGYVSKESAAGEILTCLHLVAAGRTYISASLQQKRGGGITASAAGGLREITPAERNVLKLIAQNRTTREIAEALKISPKTVENHRSKICQKLGVTGNNALVRFVLDHLGELQRL
ncbi:MAG TPA: response regulator transcription factor [Gemmatimonadaceae bacterium]|jgi:DNA-binding NarL/FixJ family response regulator